MDLLAKVVTLVLLSFVELCCYLLQGSEGKPDWPWTSCYLLYLSQADLLHEYFFSLLHFSLDFFGVLRFGSGWFPSFFLWFFNSCSLFLLFFLLLLFVHLGSFLLALLLGHLNQLIFLGLLIQWKSLSNFSLKFIHKSSDTSRSPSSNFFITLMCFSIDLFKLINFLEAGFLHLF